MTPETAARPPRRRAAAGALVLGAGLVLAATLALLLLTRAAATARALGAGTPVAATPDDVLQALAAAGAGLGLLWLVTGTALAALARAPGGLGRAAEAASVHVTPILVRTLVAALIGAVVTSGSGDRISPASSYAAISSTAVPAPRAPASTTTPTTPRLAGPAASSEQPAPNIAARLPEPGWPGDDLPAPGWTPPRPPAPVTTHVEVGLVSAAPASGRAREEHVVVHRGDTLWAIAARGLGPGASAVEIARAWPRWYAANRAVIGADPDRLQPGQILLPPTTGDDAGRHGKGARS